MPPARPSWPLPALLICAALVLPAHCGAVARTAALGGPAPGPARAGAAAFAWPGAPGADAEAVPLILMLKDKLHLETLRSGACKEALAGTTDASAPAPAQAAVEPPPAPGRLAQRPRIFGSLLPAVAGRFTRPQLEALRSCLPEGALSRVEADKKVRKAEGDSYGPWWEARGPHAPMPGAAQPPAAAAFSKASPMGLQPPGWLLARVGLRAQAALARMLQAPPAPGGARGLRAAVVTKAEPLVSAGAPAAAPGGEAPPPADSLVVTLSPVPADGAPAPPANVSSAWGENPMHALWNLDRIDQRGLPLDGKYRRPDSGRGITIYTIDSGINPLHQEFGGPGGGTRASKGPNIIDNDPNPTGTSSNDCDGHGSHVASTAVGRGVGVASGAKVVSVKVLDCHGEGSISDVVEALDWVAANAQRPAVVTLSLGVPAGDWSGALEDAVRAVVRTGVSVVVASGNSQVDACTITPARVSTAITVAASNLPSKFGFVSNEIEDLYTWGNTGRCVDIIAPGVDIFAACASDARCGHATDGTYTWASGTSMAVPHVAGWAAMYLERRPDATPAEVKAALEATATQGALSFLGEALEGTPNLLIYAPGAVAGTSARASASVGPDEAAGAAGGGEGGAGA